MSALPPPDDVLDLAFPPTTPPPRRLSPWVTAGSVVVLAAFIGLLVLGHSSSPLDRLDHPAESLARLVSRQLDLREALARSSALERGAGIMLGAYDATLDEPIEAYEELLASDVVAPAEADLHHLILLGEAGRGAEARSRAARAATSGGEPALHAAWVLAAYGDSPQDPDAGAQRVAEIRQGLPRSWFSDTLVARIAGRTGDTAASADAEAGIVTRGHALLWRWRGLTVGQLALVLAGAVAVRHMIAHRRSARLGPASLPPPWPAADGLALLARGAVGFLVIGWLPAALLSGRPEAISVIGLAAGVPAIVWTWRYLTARGVSAPDALGLRVNRAALGGLVGAALALVALGTVGEAGIGVAADLLGWQGHWADGFPEELVWERWWLVGIDTLDTALWTPFVEELMFRGVLFASFRHVLSVAPAALASALLFAVAHGYGAAGFASVLWSGIIWALAYERTRSLWPGIAAHAVNNLIVNVTIVGLLRV